jgi:hypothetical protein
MILVLFYLGRGSILTGDPTLTFYTPHERTKLFSGPIFLLIVILERHDFLEPLRDFIFLQFFSELLLELYLLLFLCFLVGCLSGAFISLTC